MRWLFCNKVNRVSVNNSRPAGEEVTGTIKKGVTEILKKIKKGKNTLKRTFNYFPRPRLNI